MYFIDDVLPLVDLDLPAPEVVLIDLLVDGGIVAAALALVLDVIHPHHPPLLQLYYSLLQLLPLLVYLLHALDRPYPYLKQLGILHLLDG